MLLTLQAGRSRSVLKTGKTLNDKFNKKDFNVFSALIHLEDVLTLFPTRDSGYVAQGSNGGSCG